MRGGGAHSFNMGMSYTSLSRNATSNAKRLWFQKGDPIYHINKANKIGRGGGEGGRRRSLPLRLVRLVMG